MSDQDPTPRITVDEQHSLRPPARRRWPHVAYRPLTHRPSDITGDPADDTPARAFSSFIVTAPPDDEAARIVRDALPVGAPGIDVDQVLAAMPATQSQDVTLRALRHLVADQEVTRQQDEGQHATYWRPVPHPSRTAEASTSTSTSP